MKRQISYTIALVAVFFLELWIFSGSFDKYFNHDTLFYLIHPPRTWGRMLELLAGPDPVQQYRPMTLAVMSLILPFSGLDPGPYHWIPLVFHLVNTWLFYLLARRLTATPLAALAAVIFWGLHSAAAYVTYDIGYFPDFLMAFFALSCLVLAVQGHSEGSVLKGGLALLLYLGALLTKEAMIMLPLALAVCLALDESKSRGLSGTRADIIRVLKRIAPIVGVYLVLAIAHAARLAWWVHSGLLYGKGRSGAYNINPFGNWWGKAHYLYWALNLPDRLAVPHPNRTRGIALLLMGGLLLLLLAGVFRRRFKLSLLEIGGLVWFAGMMLPALMLSTRTCKWYLYVPVMGLALTLGSLTARLEWPVGIPRKLLRATVLPFFIASVFFSSWVQTRSFLNSSDPAYVSTVVENCLRDFQEAHPTLPPEVTLYLLPTFETNVSDLFGGGPLYQMFYPRSRVRMLFADYGDRLPPDFTQRDDLWILQYLYGHIYDVSQYYKGRRGDAHSVRVVQQLSRITSVVDRAEFYPSYEKFDTPGGTPVFFPTPEKEILTQIGGSTAKVSLGKIPAGAKLRFDTSWMHDTGDGAWAEAAIRAGSRETLLYRKYMIPNASRRPLRWYEVVLDLSTYEGKEAELILRCKNKPGNSSVADWLNWRDIRLESRQAGP